MVRIEDITEMVDQDLDDFYNDRDRFKRLKMFVDFTPSEYEHKAPEIQIDQAKFKKKLRASTFVKGNNKNKGLF